METPILDMLKGAAKSAPVRFCMPGHKGKAASLGAEVDFLDITELPGADNLYNPDGAIMRSQRRYASSIGARSSFYLVNGSTCGVHAALLSALKPKSKVIAARDVHVSAISGFILGDIEPVFIPNRPSKGPLPNVVTPEEIEHAIMLNRDAKAVYITYPNYYGLCPDLETIAAMAHEARMLLICDSAHGAAFPFSQQLPASPSECSCDLWTVSLHKTLPALNQCAALSIGKECTAVSPALVQSRLNWLQTTSPSYLLLGSCDYVTALMAEEGALLISHATERVHDAIWRIGKLGGYRVLTSEVPYQTGAYDRDLLRVVIDVTDRGLTGVGAARDLHRRGIAVEAADLSNLILICSVADSKEDFDRLVAALRDIKGGIYSIEQPVTNADVWSLYGHEFVMPMREAALSARETVPFQESAGRTAAVSMGLYPPGVPVVMPGQRIESGTVRTLERLRKSGFDTFGFTDTVEVVSSR